MGVRIGDNSENELVLLGKIEVLAASQKEPFFFFF